MKIILLSLVIMLSLLVQANNLSPKIDICKLKDVIENGWTDTNQTLNNAIIKLGTTKIPQILSQLNQPISVDINNTDIDKIPKFILTRDDYSKLFAYSKYLEFKGDEQDVSSYYIRAAEGLHDVNDYSFISFIYKLVINPIIIRSLNQSLDNKIFTSDSKQLLKSKLKKLLILDNEILLRTIEHNREVQLYYTNQITMKKEPSLFNKQLYDFFMSYMLTSINKEFTTTVLAIQTNTLEKNIAKRKKEIIQHSTLTKHIAMWILESKLKIYNFFSLENDNDNDDYKRLAHYMVDDSMLIQTPALDRTYNDYAQMIEKNKQLLLRLNLK